MQHFFRLLRHLALALIIAAPSAVAAAEGWGAIIADSDVTPRRVIAVDKSLQRLHIFERQSPLKLRNSFDCTTGQVVGDKKSEGDKRTPEGIYFIEHKQTRGLDYEMYGGIAYILNYPNPVDRLRQKSGSGIWIHSKGREIAPRETRGCIALNLNDIDRLDRDFAPGTPVAVANAVATDAAFTKQDIEIARKLHEKVRLWAKAWSARSADMFDYYDADAYSLAQDAPFHAFRNQKEHLFSILPWIHTTISDIRVLQGPGYWVTWFNQYYRAPNHTSEGIRRLYWQPDANNELRIVGMEWVPADLNMESAYLESITAEVSELINTWRDAWEKADAEAYAACYAPDAKQGDRTGIKAIRDHKLTLWQTIKPTKVALEGVRIEVTRDGVKADMTQDYRDTRGYRDSGIKIIHLQPHGATWRIVREDWAPAPTL